MIFEWCRYFVHCGDGKCLHVYIGIKRVSLDLLLRWDMIARPEITITHWFRKSRVRCAAFPAGLSPRRFVLMTARRLARRNHSNQLIACEKGLTCELNEPANSLFCPVIISFSFFCFFFPNQVSQRECLKEQNWSVDPQELDLWFCVSTWLDLHG